VRPRVFDIATGLALLVALAGCGRFGFDVVDHRVTSAHPATHLAFARQPWNPAAANRELPVQVRILDAGGNQVVDGPDATAEITLALTSGSGPLQGNLTATALGGLVDFTGEGVSLPALGTGLVITASKPDTSASGGTGAASVASAAFDVVANAAWTGSLATSGWLFSDQTPAFGRGDGMLDNPTFALVDGTNLYVSDAGNGRVVKFDLTNGAFLGWIGEVGEAPTGGAGYDTSSGITNGWCTGGTGMGGSTASGCGALPHASGLFAYLTYLYVADGYSAISRFDKSTGAFAGWIGGVGDMPTSDGAGNTVGGCNTTHSGHPTPGWCMGGVATSDVYAGALDSPTGVAGDGIYLYVADATNNRVSRYNLATGAPAGWIGRIGGGTCGAGSASVGQFSGAWCTSGVAKAGTAADGSLAFGYTSPGLWVSSLGDLYVADSSQVNRYKAASGAFTGWVGQIGTKPTAGALDCTTATVGSATPGWCTGGASEATVSPGGLGEVDGLWSDGTSLYAADNGWNGGDRVMRFDLASGAFTGWLGGVGAPACTSTTTGDYTGKWCMDGLSASSTAPGAFIGFYGRIHGIVGLAGDGTGTSLFVVAQTLGVVGKYTRDAGAAFDGWVGAYASPTSGWLASGLSAGSFSGDTLAQPAGIYADATHLFVTDYGKVAELDRVTGQSTGWVGAVGASSPTGGASGCVGLTPESNTPGWCTGGAPEPNAPPPATWSIPEFEIDGEGCASDGTYLYVAAGPAIERFLIATGEYQGWIGAVSTPPSDLNCQGLHSGDTTPHWCMDGSAAGGSGDGQFSGILGLYCDGTYLYAADSSGARIEKLVATTGAFVGWVGQIGTEPTGGATGCTMAAVGSATPGWCTGGGAKAVAGSTVPGDGSLTTPYGVAGDGTYVFVVDYAASINRYNAATGAFAGWIGQVASAPAAPDPCAGLSAGSLSTAWCKGGTHTSSIDSMPGLASAYSDGVNLYAGLAGPTPNAIFRFSAVAGTPMGWWGQVHLTPTGGDSSCTQTIAGETTPGWCTGGEPSSTGGTTLGSISGASGITGFGNFIYITDIGRSRIIRVAK